MPESSVESFEEEYRIPNDYERKDIEIEQLKADLEAAEDEIKVMQKVRREVEVRAETITSHLITKVTQLEGLIEHLLVSKRKGDKNIPLPMQTAFDNTIKAKDAEIRTLAQQNKQKDEKLESIEKMLRDLKVRFTPAPLPRKRSLVDKILRRNRKNRAQHYALSCMDNVDKGIDIMLSKYCL